MQRWLRVLFEADLRHQWQQIQLPQYHLYADQDAIVACNHKKWIRQYTNAQHEVIDNSCHGLPIQRPALLAQKIHHWFHQYA